MSEYLYTAAQERHFLVPDGTEIPAGDLAVSSSGGEVRRVDAAAVAPFEVTLEDALAHVRRQTERSVAGLIDLLGGAVDPATGTLADPGVLANLLAHAAGEMPELRVALGGLAKDVETLVSAVASGQPLDLDAVSTRLDRFRPLDPRPDDESTRELGRRLDALVDRLEKAVGDNAALADRSKERRQEEYLRDAESSIADSLREAGFTPFLELRNNDG